MNRTKSTVANAVVQAMSVLVQSVFSLIVTREIIKCIGSDLNGINSTATQLLSVLSLLEGGFTVATLVKLYKPYAEKNTDKLNQYLSLSKLKYQKIGVLYFLVGVVFAVVYTPFVKTSADSLTTCMVMILTVFSSAFTIYYVSKFRLLFQVSQSEYILYAIQFVSNILMYITEIAIVRLTKNIICARICIMLFQVLTGIVIGIAAKRRFNFLSFSQKHNGVSIEGTKDVFVSKFSGMIYSSASVFFISTFVGTAYTSVFAVYNSVVNIISNYINVVLSAPRNALGQIINEDKVERSRLLKAFEEYEFIAVAMVSYLASITYALVIPFVRMYTASVADVNYIDETIAALLIINYVLQMIHIPSGTCIEVAGKFKAVKYIQLITAALMIVSTVVLGHMYSLYGILFARVITSFVLAVMETIYTRRCVLDNKFMNFIKYTLSNIGIGIILAGIEYKLLYPINFTLYTFILVGILLVVVNGLIYVAVNYLINRELIISAFKRFKQIFYKKQRRNNYVSF